MALSDRSRVQRLRGPQLRHPIDTFRREWSYPPGVTKETRGQIGASASAASSQFGGLGMTLTHFVKGARNGAPPVRARHAVALLFGLALLPRIVPAQSAEDGFDPNANFPVLSLAVQPDGKIILGGYFTTLRGGAVTRNHIARVNADGSIDEGFDPNSNGTSGVSALALQSDGKILLGGDFTTLSGGTISRNYIARLSPDGEVDLAFNPNANQVVESFTLQSDGKILIGGGFTTLNGGALTRNYIARLNADGSVDLTFDPDADGDVLAQAVQSDGKILIGGNFTTLNGGAITRNHIARLNADGSVDPAFDPNADGAIEAVALQPDGRILIGGAYSTLNGGAVTRHNIARLDADGNVDAAFDPDTNGYVQALAVQADGKTLLGGYFSTLHGGLITRFLIARLNADGTVDSTFDPDANFSSMSFFALCALALQSDGRILLAGGFDNLNNGSVMRSHIARINADGSADDTLAPNANGPVDTLAVQPDSALLLAGEFTASNGGGTISRDDVARINVDGSIDGAFNPDATNGVVSAVAVQPADGKILIGGSFGKLLGGTVTRNCVARLNADGSVDNGFDPDANCVNGVYALAVQSDGKILVGGDFTAFHGGTVPRNHIARLNADGSIDASFDPDANGAVSVLVVQSDGKILLGGGFTSLNGGAVTRNYIARLNADGSVDATFDPNANDGVDALALQADARILVGGNFTRLNAGAVTRNHIARLNADGSVDSTFNPDADSNVLALAVQSGDGKILLGGHFFTLNGGVVARSGVARLNAAGTVDSTFNPNPNGYVDALALQSDGGILLGGGFTTLNSGAVTRNHIARIRIDGTVDAAFDPNANSPVEALVVQPDGRILLGGYFSTVNVGPIPRHYVARYTGFGQIDAAFNPDANNGVSAVAAQPDAKIVLGGSFTTLNGGAVARNHIARIDAAGNVEATFNPNASDSIDALALQPDGKIVLGGYFTSLNGGSLIRNYVARLNGDGSVDSFNPNANGAVATVAVQPDGNIVLGGYFTSVHGTTRNYLARVGGDGSLDGSFNPNADSSVLTAIVQPDGQTVIGGNFSSLKGGAVIRHHIARLHSDGSVDPTFDPNADGIVYTLALQADGKILLGGGFDTLNGGMVTRNHIARLNADGSVDLTYDPNADQEVDALAIESDGKVLLGGIFAQLNGSIPRSNVARLSSPQPAIQSLNVDGTTVSWLRSGAGPELALPPTLEMSSDAITYTPLGTLSRINGGWAASGILIEPVNQIFYLRARGQTTSGAGNGSQGLIESVRQLYGSDRVFLNGFE